MPKSKTAAAGAPSQEAQPKTKRSGAPKSAVAAHKHKASKSIDSAVESPILMEQPRLAPEEIAKLAYSFWEARGYRDGDPEQDWLRAERELSVFPQNR